MDLKTYLSEGRGRQAELAKALGAHAPDVSRWAVGKRPIPFEYGAAIESATGGLVTRKEMFPDDWQRFWPELAIVGQPAIRRATDPVPPPGRAGRTPSSRKNVMEMASEQPALYEVRK